MRGSIATPIQPADPYTRRMASSPDVTHQDLDFYAVLDVDPAATPDQLRVAFRRAVLRHHPDRSGTATGLATRRTSLLNRAWSELRDPARRRAYDGALERGEAATVAWPVTAGEPPRAGSTVRRPRRGGWPPSRVRGISPPGDRSRAASAAVYLDQPEAQRRWIVEHHIEGRTGATTGSAIGSARRRPLPRAGRLDDWVGARGLVEIDRSFDTLARSNLRSAYEATDRHLAGATFWPGRRALARGERGRPGSSARCARCSRTFASGMSVAARRQIGSNADRCSTTRRSGHGADASRPARRGARPSPSRPPSRWRPCASASSRCRWGTATDGTAGAATMPGRNAPRPVAEVARREHPTRCSGARPWPASVRLARQRDWNGPGAITAERTPPTTRKPD
jgi:curved DNA-binding protein CbpA